MIKANHISRRIVLPYECKCCMFVIEKTAWEDGGIDYDISIQDSRYDHNYNTLRGRIKRTVFWGVLTFFKQALVWQNSSSMQSSAPAAARAVPAGRGAITGVQAHTAYDRAVQYNTGNRFLRTEMI